MWILGNGQYLEVQKESYVADYDVFISYSHKDSDWVHRELLPALESSSLKTCIDFRDFLPGVPSIVNMENAVENSNHTLIILTPGWLSSEWAEFESIMTATRDPAGRRRKLIPIMLSECALPLRLSMLTYANLTNSANRSRKLNELIASLKAPT